MKETQAPRDVNQRAKAVVDAVIARTEGEDVAEGWLMLDGSVSRKIMLPGPPRNIPAPAITAPVEVPR